jgi:hypothetical protein
MVHLALRTPEPNTFFARADEFNGLQMSDLDEGGTMAFALVRDAGSFRFDGTLKGGEGHGRFRFTPSQLFVQALQAHGLRAPTAAEQYALARNGANLALLDLLEALGYARPSTEEFLRASAQRVDLGFVQGLALQGVRAGTLENAGRLKRNGLDAELLEDLGHAGYPRLSSAQALALARQPLGDDFLDEANQQADEDPSAEDLMRIAEHAAEAEVAKLDEPVDEDVQFDAGAQADLEQALDGDGNVNENVDENIDENVDQDADPADEASQAQADTPLEGAWKLYSLADGGVAIELAWDDDTQWRRELDPSEIVAAEGGGFRIAGEAGDFVFTGKLKRGLGHGRFRFEPNRGFPARLGAAGIRGSSDWDTHKLKNLAWGGASVQAAREFQALGLRDLSLEGLTDLAVFNIRPDTVREMRAQGIKETRTVEELTDARVAMQVEAER